MEERQKKQELPESSLGKKNLPGIRKWRQMTAAMTAACLMAGTPAAAFAENLNPADTAAVLKIAQIEAGAENSISAQGETVLAGKKTVKKSDLEKKAERIVNAKVKKGSSKEAALKTLFQYVEKTCSYSRAVGFQPVSGWEKTYALDMLRTKRGSCYHFAAAYGFLAKKATGYPVRVCIGTTNGFNKSRWQPHGWCEIKIKGKWYVFDPNMDKFAAGSRMKYYKKDRKKLMKTTYRVEKRIPVSF